MGIMRVRSALACDSGDARLEAREGLKAELSEEDFGAVALHGEEEVCLAIEKLEGGGQHSDDFGGASVKHDAASDDGSVAAESGLPILVTDDDGSGAAGRIVVAGEETSEHGAGAEKREDTVGKIDSGDDLRLGEAGDGEVVSGPHADILEGLVLVAVGEVEKGRDAGAGEVHARRGMVHGDQAVRIGIGERLQENPFEDAEDRCVGSDAES